MIFLAEAHRIEDVENWRGISGQINAFKNAVGDAQKITMFTKADWLDKIDFDLIIDRTLTGVVKK